jgi:HEAT repeat protein
VLAAIQVAVVLSDASFVPAALGLSTHTDPTVRRSAAQLLARTGGQRAAAALVRLIRDPDASVRAGAAAGIGVLGHWPAAPALAIALEDESWDVRSAAAGSLRRLGPAGRIYLRRAVGGPDQFAADISRQVLEFPDSALRTVVG